jgi:mono/diheme cytochrome c family protein
VTDQRIEPPYVAAAKARKRVPLWAVPIFPLLLVWGIVYVNAMQPPVNNHDPLAQGAVIYGKYCSGCHGATGGGGSGPSFNAGAVLKTFPKWGDQVQWVDIGATNWPNPTYGATKKSTGNKAMPGFGPDGNAGGLTCDQIALVVNYERVQLAGESPTAEADLNKLVTSLATGATADVPTCAPKK